MGILPLRFAAGINPDTLALRLGGKLEIDAPGDIRSVIPPILLNSAFIVTIKRVNRVRRLLSYRTMQHRERYAEHARQHLHVLELLERERNEEASMAMREHLRHTIDALSRIRAILEP